MHSLLNRIGAVLALRVEYHHAQALHPFAASVEKVTVKPDASGMLVGFLDDTDAPARCPGIDTTLFIKAPTQPERRAIMPKTPARPIVANPMTATSVAPVERPIDLTPLPANLSHIPEANTPIPVALPPAFQPIVYPRGSFRVKLVMDKREVNGAGADRAFMGEELLRRDVYFDQRVLDVGDITWVAISNTGQPDVILDYIVERKRMDDLASSIMDGRFFEQKLRLSACGLRNVFYLVEEFDNVNVDNFGRDALRTAMASTQTLSNFFVKRTAGVDDTVRFLRLLTKVIQKRYEVGFCTLIIY